MKTFNHTVMYREEPVSEIKLEFDPTISDVVMIHHDVYRWSPGIYKVHLEVLAQIEATLKQEGFSKLVAAYHSDRPDSDKIRKYWELWGFVVSEQDVAGIPMIIGELEL